MAQFRAEFEETEPVVNVYEFDETLFQKFHYKRFEAYTAEWAHFVYDHRTEPHGRTLHDCYPLQFISDERTQANIKKNAVQWETFTKYLESKGKLRK